MKMTQLSTMDPFFQTCAMAQIARGLMSASYYDANLRELMERPEIFKGKVKQLYNRTAEYVRRFINEIDGMISDQETKEIMYDVAYELQREAAKSIWYREQAVKRLCDKKKFSDTAFLSKMALSKDLLDLSSYIQGMEAKYRPQLGIFCRWGHMPLMLGYMASTDDSEKSYPNTLGFLARACGKMNLAILEALGLYSLKVTEDEATSEEAQAMHRSGLLLQEVLMDYELIGAMFSDHGHTLEEAKEIVKERRAKLTKDKERAAKREEVKKAKKLIKSKEQ